MKNKQLAQSIQLIKNRVSPEKGLLIGYGAIITAYSLKIPLPDFLSLISEKDRKYETDQWHVFSPVYQPADTLYGHLTFALKYEGVDLRVLKLLFLKLNKNDVIEMVSQEPLSQYSRKIWFLYEWLLNTQLNIPDLETGNFIPLLDKDLQYVGEETNSRRHRIKNNLPGTRDFCPLIRRTPKLDTYISLELAQKNLAHLKNVHVDVLSRASAFLLLKDSKASFAIEGEQPPRDRAMRWGFAIGQAGTSKLTKEEFLKLQNIVIGDDTRFTHLGWRMSGGFVGEHDRKTLDPIPAHISARWQDIDALITGLIDTINKLENTNFDPVLAATMIAFGFVFVHPFEDGNGRLHRYLVHDMLARMKFAQPGIVFPVSAAILEHIDDYRKVLEEYSSPLLEYIEWTQTEQHNVEVLNETIDFYRYFDATKQAEFLYQCVEQTIEEIIPAEIKYLHQYDEMKIFLDSKFAMSDKTTALLIHFLEQNHGRLSARARSHEFAALNAEEIGVIEEKFSEIFEE